MRGYFNEVGTFGPYNYKGLFWGFGVESEVYGTLAITLGFRIGPGDILVLVNVLTKA